MTPTEIIAALGGRSAVAETVERPVNTVIYWERRGHIPSRYWPALMGQAQKLSASTITLEALVNQRPAPQAAA